MPDTARVPPIEVLPETSSAPDTDASVIVVVASVARLVATKSEVVAVFVTVSESAVRSPDIVADAADIAFVIVADVADIAFVIVADRAESAPENMPESALNDVAVVVARVLVAFDVSVPFNMSFVPVSKVSVPFVYESLVSLLKNCREASESKVSALPTLSEDAAVHNVLVPDVVRTCPAEPVVPLVSLSLPVIERFSVVAFVAIRLVEVAFVVVEFVVVRLVAVALVMVALVVVRLVEVRLVVVALVAIKLSDVRLVEYRLVEVAFVVVAFVMVEFVNTRLVPVAVAMFVIFFPFAFKSPCNVNE